MKESIICISGNIAVGKSEVAKILADKLGFTLYKASESFRAYARKLNMSLVEFNDYVKNNPDIDLSIEEHTKEVASVNTNMVIDARLGFYVAPHSFKVYMVADIDEAAKRLYNASKNRGKEENYLSEKEAKNAIEHREKSEWERYMKLYNVDIHNLSSYDFVIDTTNLTQQEVADKIYEAYMSLEG